MIANKFVAELRQIVGKSHVSTSRMDTEIYSYDASLAKGEPDVIVFPADTSEVSRVMELAYSHGVSFLPRGFGTNLSGGTILRAGGLVICLSRLNRILAMYPDRRYAVVQVGVTNLELQDALAAIGFFYAPDPASQKVATLGGNIGENSGGPRCLKYGVTTNHVLGLEFIQADGEVFKLGGAALDPPGYDLRGVVIGSEGTFGIVSEVTVRILPLAENVITMLAIYDEVADAARSVSAMITAGMIPTTLEMMDALIIKAVEDSYACGYPRDAAAVLIIELDGPPAGLKEQAEKIREFCLENGCREINEAKNEEERNRLWEGRRGAFGAVARLAPSYLVNDCTVPRTRLPEALESVAQIAKKYDFSYGNVFHAGDGNLHPLLFFDSRDQDQLKRVKKAGWEIMEACVNLGGTISGEHGIGIEKMEALRLINSEADLEVQRRLKKAFDPKNLLNPGKVIPAPKKPGKEEESKLSTADGMVAKPLKTSQPERAIMDIIKKAAAEQQAIVPVGKGSHSSSENLCQGSTLKIDSSGLDHLNLSDLDNQVAVAGAGMTLENFQTELALHRHWLPIRPPFSHRGYSIGGLIALGACGPERIFHGAPRDRLLGLRYVNHEGHLISTGGKVVKNVSGYDMTRLMAGSAGTLGFIVEATFRVSLLPERSTALVASGPFQACFDVAAKFNVSTLQAVFNVIVPDQREESATETDNWKIYLGFEGFAQTVDYQLEQAGSIMAQGGLTGLQKIDYKPTVGVFTEYFKDLDDSSFILRADLPLHELVNFMNSLNSCQKASHKLVDCGSGRMYAAFETVDEAVWRQICDLALKYQGHAIMEKAPDQFKKNNDLFGAPRPEWKISHNIKAALDPQNIFAPGRLPGKI